MDRVAISRVDPADGAMLRACHQVELASIAHDRPDGLPRTLGELTADLRADDGWVGRSMLVATSDGAPAGTVQVDLTQRDNRHLGSVLVHVIPGERRRGIGRVLHDAARDLVAADGRTMLLTDVESPLDGSCPGLDVARRWGYEEVHAEERLVLALPVDGAHLDSLRRGVAGYEVLTWTGPTPVEHVAAVVELRSRMESDVPLGDIDWERLVFDADRLRAVEERVRATHDTVTALSLRDDGAPAAYSWLGMARDDLEVVQEDTVVMPGDRGRGLGLQLKLATLEVVQRDHADRSRLHTWTDPTNLAMYHVNRRLGFTPVERGRELQRPV